MRYPLCEATGMMESPAERLKWARTKAGYETASDAARSRGWKVSTYLGHENGDRVPSRETAKRYARAFKVGWVWILEGEGQQASEPRVPIVGTINPGAKVQFDENRSDTAPCPPEGADDMIALLGGSSVMPGVIEEDWIVYCRKARRTPLERDIGKTALICIAGGEIFIGRIFRGRGDLFDVVSVTFESRRDVRIEWISPVEWIKPS